MSYSRGSSWDMSSSTPELSSHQRSFTFTPTAFFTISFIASTASLLSIILLVIASSTDHWSEVKVDREEIARSHPPALDMYQIRYYSRNTGLFRICFSDLIAQPTDGMYLSPLGELCTTNPAWTPSSISFNSTSPFTSFNSTSPFTPSSHNFHVLTPLLLVVSITIMSTSFLLSLSSCWSPSNCSARFTSSAVFQLLGTAVAMTAMATWHIASFLHDVETQADGAAWPDWLRRSTAICVGWSYCVAWTGIALSLVATMVWFAAAFVRRNRRKLYQEGHNWCSLYHSASFNHTTPSYTAQAPPHSGESCHAWSVTCGELPCHESRPTSQAANLPSHQVLPSQEMRLGCSHSCFSRSYSSLNGEAQMYNGAYSRRCEGNQISSCRGSTSSETSSEGRRTRKWLDNSENGNAAEEINVMDQMLARSRNESHPELIGDSKEFVEHSNKTISYEDGEALDGQDSEEDLDRIDEALVEGDLTNYDGRIEETFDEKSDPLQDKREQLDSPIIGHCKRKISFREDWNTPGVVPYNKDVSNIEDRYNSRIELYNNEVSNNEDWYNSRIELYNNEVSESEDWETSRLKHYNKMSNSEEWDTSRLERYNKKMLQVLNNTFSTMHSSDKYIREMLEF